MEAKEAFEIILKMAHRQNGFSPEEQEAKRIAEEYMFYWQRFGQPSHGKTWPQSPTGEEHEDVRP